MVDEVLANIVAYFFDDDEEHEIILFVEMTNDRVVITVPDDGTPFKPRSGSELDLTVALQERKIGGLGIHLVKNVMDEVRYDRQANRNVVSAVKYLRDHE